MALTEQVQLDIQAAQRQINQLEQQLSDLSTPINVPVNVTGEGALSGVTQDLARSDDAVEDLNRELRRTEGELRDVEGAADRGTQGVLRFGTRGASVFSNFRGSLLGVVGAFGAIQGTRAFVGFARDNIAAASDLEESTSKAQEVFGEFFDDIQQFAGEAPQALGLANQQALEFTGTFGNLFTALGLSQSAAADLAPEIVELGSDLASFNNLEVTEALDKLRAGLVGEAEPLRALGVNLNAAAVEAKALELGLADSASEIDDAAKVQARYALILEQTATAQGDFDRTSDSIANRQRILAAEFQTTREVLGEALLPAFEKLLDIMPSLIDALENGLVPAFAGLSAAASDVDTSGFVANIAGLPSAIGTVATQFTAGGEAVGNALQTFAALARLDFGDLGTQFQQLGDDLQRFGEAGPANSAIQTLIETLTAGVDPATALNQTLFNLGQDASRFSVGGFEDLATQLVTMAEAAGATGPEMASLADQVEEFGQEAGFSASGVEILVGLLRGIAEEKEIEAQLDRDVSGLLRLGAAARDTTPNIERSAEGLAAFRAQVNEIRAGQIAEEMEAVGAVFNQLPDEMDAAAAALRDSEGEIVTDFTDFLSNLEDEIEARQAFRSNVAILQAMGLDDLAQVFADAGLESAAALADAVANPEEAARAEALLDAEAERIGDSFRQTLVDVIQAADLDLTIGADATIAIQSLVLSGLDTATAQATVGNEQRRAVGGVGSAAGDQTIINNTQNFEGFTPSDTDLARANQAVHGVIP